MDEEDVGRAVLLGPLGRVGRQVAVGDRLVLVVRSAMPRCVMVDMSQPGTPAADGLLATVTRLNDMCLGVLAEVVEPGPVRLGDGVRLLD